MFEEGFRIGFLDDDTAVDKDDTVCDSAGEVHFVGDDHHRHPLLCQRQHDIKNFTDHFRVKGSGHFIKQHNLRMHGQRPYNGDTLFLSAAELPGICGPLIQQSDTFQQAFRFGLCLFLRNFLNLNRCQCDVVLNRKMRKQFIALEYHADALTKRRHICAVLCDLLSVECNGSALVFLQAVHTSKQCGLSASGWSKHHDHLPFMDIQRDSVEHFGCALVGFHKILYRKQNFICHLPLPPFPFQPAGKC